VKEIKSKLLIPILAVDIIKWVGIGLGVIFGLAGIFIAVKFR